MTVKKKPLLDGERRLAVRVKASDLVRLSVLRAQAQRSLQSVLTEALNEWLKKRGEGPLKELDT